MPKTSFSIAKSVFFLTGLLVFCGCNPPQDPLLDLADSQLGVQEVNDLERTMKLAVSDTSFDFAQYEEKVSGGLNRWIAKSIEKGGESADDSQLWNLDPMVEELTTRFSAVPAVAKVAEREFVSTDPYFIREQSWMKLIAERLVEGGSLDGLELQRLQAGGFTPPQLLVSGENESADADPDSESATPAMHLFQELYPDLDKETVGKIVAATLLFDWTVRNIQLEPAADISESELDNYRLTSESSGERSAMGVPGPGYRRFNWQTLVYGRGDYLEKAKLFSGMLRQRGIDSAMLTINGSPWAVAALIGDKAWLFDARLGLPIPAEKPGRIATLDEIRQNPELLTRLNLTVDESSREDSDYWVKPDDLQSLGAHIFCSPEGVSRRMAFLENRLLGEQRLVLTENPSRLTERLKRVLTDIGSITVSPVPFQTHEFRKVVGEARNRAVFDEVVANNLSWYFREEAYIDEFVDYRSARNLFFIGRFETPRNSRKFNAVAGFNSLIYTDDLIANIALNTPLLTRLGVDPRNQNTGEFQARLQGLQQNMRLVRRDVGLFLAQSHFDNGNINSAANWLARMRKREDTKHWAPLMRYLEGRGLERTGDYDAAIERYQSSDGAQFLGDLLRARLLTEAIGIAGLTRKSDQAGEKKPDDTETGDADESGDQDGKMEAEGSDAAEGGGGKGTENQQNSADGNGGGINPIDGDSR